MIELYNKLDEYGVKMESSPDMLSGCITYTFRKGKEHMSVLVAFDNLVSTQVKAAEKFLLEKLDMFVRDYPNAGDENK